jgi:hypothetical protein
MTKTAISIVLAVLLLVGGWIGYERWQDHRRAQRTAAETALEGATANVEASKDSVKVHEPGVAHADSNLTHATTQPTRVTVIRWIHDTVGTDSSAFVPRASYDTLWTEFADLRTAAIAYRDSSRALLIRYPRLVSEQDSVIKYQRIIINTPKPRRNWGLGISGGYGATSSGGKIVTGPSVNVGISYSF